MMYVKVLSQQARHQVSPPRAYNVSQRWEDSGVMKGGKRSGSHESRLNSINGRLFTPRRSEAGEKKTPGSAVVLYQLTARAHDINLISLIS